MTEPLPSTTAQKLVVEQKGNRLKKAEWKEGIQIYLGFNIKILFFFTWTKNVSDFVWK